MDKIYGSLLGLHVGDSLGATLEFGPPRDRNNFHVDITGGGKIGYKPGDPTDDTEMMMMLLESIVENKSFDIYDLSSRFMHWWLSNPPDIGNTTYHAIENMVNGKSPGKWGLSGVLDQGNGSLMRCAPLALLNLNLFKIAKHTAMTHNTSNCIVSDFLLISGIKDCFMNLDKKQIFTNTLNRIPENHEKIKEELESIPNTKWEDLQTTGYVIHTLKSAFWGLYHFDSFEEAIIEVVNRGDDSDTCGAVTGALCGAYFGMGAIPKRWLEVIQLREKIMELAKNGQVKGLW